MSIPAGGWEGPDIPSGGGGPLDPNPRPQRVLDKGPPVLFLVCAAPALLGRLMKLMWGLRAACGEGGENYSAFFAGGRKMVPSLRMSMS